jgi:hypothetical protein
MMPSVVSSDLEFARGRSVWDVYVGREYPVIPLVSA